MPAAYCGWKGAPHIDVDSDDDGCTFIDHYITGKIPLDTGDGQNVGDVVIKPQTHSHSHIAGEYEHADLDFQKHQVQEHLMQKARGRSRRP